MKKRITLILSMGLMTTLSFAKPFTLELDEERDPLGKGASLLTTTLLIDEDGTNDGSISLGFEGRFGQSFKTLEEVGIALAHVDNEDADTTRLYAYASEQYDLGFSFLPYVGLGFGYGWAALDAGDDIETYILLLESGIRYPLTPNIIINLGVRVGFSDKEFYIEDDGINDKNLEFGLGVSWQY